MCGITGIWSKKNIDSQGYYKAHMQLKHRGPDDEGFIYMEENGFNHAKGDDSIEVFSQLPHIKSI
jgi:asparagine synthase (glutamine-hydrolysing)